MTITELLAENRTPVTDDEIWAEIGDMTGTAFVNYDEVTYERGDETFIEEVRGAEIVAFFDDEGPILTRDQLGEIVGRSVLDEIEVRYAEKRRELI